MSDKTDKAARAIIDYKGVFDDDILTVAVQDGTEDGGDYGEPLCNLVDLQKLAKFWLLKDAILWCINDPYPVEPGTEKQKLLDKIKELDG